MVSSQLDVEFLKGSLILPLFSDMILCFGRVDLMMSLSLKLAIWNRVHHLFVPLNLDLYVNSPNCSALLPRFMCL